MGKGSKGELGARGQARGLGEEGAGRQVGKVVGEVEALWLVSAAAQF